MFILIMGGNGSGKSACAEAIAAQIAGPRVYAATMVPHGDQGRERVEKHRRQRSGLGFVTMERPLTLADVSAPGGLVLLEDLSDLLGNVMFDSSRRGSLTDVLQDIDLLRGRCDHLIAVTIDGLEPQGYDGETAAFIEALNELNRTLQERAQCVIAMKDRKPHVIKGDCPWLS